MSHGTNDSAFIEALSSLYQIMPAGWGYLIGTVLSVAGFMVILIVGLWNRWALVVN